MESLRHIPPVNDILRSEHLAKFRNGFEPGLLMRVIDETLARVRSDLLAGQDAVPRVELTDRIAREVAARLTLLVKPALCRVINASGVILHTNLGRSPLSSRAIDHLRAISTRYSNLEFSLESGSRGIRDEHINRLLREILGCEAAIAVNNNAAAVLLVLNTLGEGGEVIVSRGEQVEIGGSFRIPEVMVKSGARLREVGTTNRTRIRDYEKAVNESTRLLLRVHPSNFRITGFTARPSLEEFVDLGRRRNVPTFEDLGSGCLVSLDELGIRDEPVAGDSIRAGVDVISFSGDKLMGGPQAGIIAGRQTYIQKIRENPLFRALRLDKLTISVLESVLMSYLSGNIDEIPIWTMLRARVESLKSRAEAFALKMGTGATVTPLNSRVGGGAAPESDLPSWGVRLSFPEITEGELEHRLRHADPPVVVRIEDGAVIVDFRTVFPSEDDELIAVIRKAAS